MKASELIRILAELKAKHGDLEVVYESSELIKYTHFEEVRSVRNSLWIGHDFKKRAITLSAETITNDNCATGTTQEGLRQQESKCQNDRLNHAHGTDAIDL